MKAGGSHWAASVMSESTESRRHENSTQHSILRKMRTHIEMRFRDLDHFLLLLFFVSLLLNTTCRADDYRLLVQRTISVQRGLCVYIPCSFTVADINKPSEAAIGIWYKGKQKPENIVSSQEISQVPRQNQGRIFFTGNALKLDCSMSINDVQSSDADEPYLFRLEDREHRERSYNYNNYLISLTVTDLTDKPEISPMSKLLAGKEVTLTCQSPGRCNGSAPLITWSGRVQGKNVTLHTVHPDGNKTYYSNITFTPTKEDHQSPLICNVNFQASFATTSNQITLNVEYPPNVNISINESFHNENTPIIVMEGNSEVIKCTVDSNPQSNITWYKEDKVLNTTSSLKTLIYNVKNANTSDAGIYRCSATNGLSVNTTTIEIVVHYAPRTPQITCSMPTDCSIDGNQTIYAREGSSVSLQCSVDSLPAAELAWSKPGNPNNTLPAKEIHLHNILTMDDGLYTCRTNNTHGSSNASVTIKVTYGPRPVSGKNSTCKEAENHIKCICIIESFPNVSIQWKINEKSYSGSDKDIDISTCRLNAETNSTLTINFNQKDVLSIECISSNQYGKFVLPFLSKTTLKSSLGMIAAVSVVVAVVVILGIAFVILQYCRRRKLKQESKEKKELTSNNHDVIYSNTNVTCNGAETSQEIPYKNSMQDDGTLYMNCQELQYASINFSKMKPKAKVEVTEPETEYASIKPQ